MSTPIHPFIASIAAGAVDAENPPRIPARPTTADQDRMLETILERHGPAGLLLAGRRFDALGEEPLVLCLLNSDTPWVLLDKIARLNRYFHASHRHRVLDTGPMDVRLEHVAITGSGPTSAQSLFVCGLYLALLEEVGCEGVTAAFPDETGRLAVAYDTGAALDVPTERTNVWHISWKHHHAQRVLPGLDAVLLADAPLDLEAASTGNRAADVLRADPGRTWRVGDLAAALHLSGRSLQRRLRSEGTSFSRILAGVRIDEARHLLRTTQMTVGDIGYTTGFADTAHFSRTFRETTGMTPTEWRSTAAP